MFESIRSKVLREDQLEKLRRDTKGKTIVFCSGCYDILQSGHAVFFNQCKSNGDILVVGVGRDSVITALKGPGRPVNPENNRVYLVAAMQDVDYAVLNGKDILPGKIDFAGIIDKLRPDILVLNEDDTAVEEKISLCRETNTRLHFVKRVVPPELESTSTTRIIDKINFSWKAPLRIDFAGGWTDIPFLMKGETGYVSNVAIRPLIEYKAGKFNFSGYPRGSGLSTSTAAKLLEMISSPNYNTYSKTLTDIAEDLFELENKELNWAIGRQDQYAIVHGGFNSFEFASDHAKKAGKDISHSTIEKFRKNLLLIHTGASRNAQQAVEEVYNNHTTQMGRDALDKLAKYGIRFSESLNSEDFRACAEIMEANFSAQKQLAKATSNSYLDEMFSFAKKNGAVGGKICGAGGGGAFIFYCSDPVMLKNALKKRFVECFEIDFDFESNDIKRLNSF